MSQSDPSGEQPKVRWPETLRSPVLRSELCSPVYRCFPPMAGQLALIELELEGNHAEDDLSGVRSER